MRNLLLFLPVLMITGLLLTSCKDAGTNPPPDPGKCFVNIASEPIGAVVYIDGSTTARCTTIAIPIKDSLVPGDHSFKFVFPNSSVKTLTFNLIAKDTPTVVNATLSKGVVNVGSDPAGAKVYVDASTTEFINGSPLYEGSYKFKFVFSDNNTVTKTVSVTAGVTNSVTCGNFKSFSTAQIWETAATGDTQFSGLVLKTGLAIGFSDPKNATMDLFFAGPDTLESAYLSIKATLDRHTYFRMSDSTNLDDGVSAPQYSTSTWGNITTQAILNLTHYFWIYDADGNYSKAKVTEYHAKTSVSDPAYVKLKYYYNSKGSRAF